MRKKTESILGIAPIGKFAFSHENALKQKEKLFAQLRTWKIPFVDIDGVVEDGMLRAKEQVAPIAAYLRDRNVDALFVPHCNFGTEDAAGMLARQMNVPTLLWGPRDKAPLSDGSRYRDSLCGCFATSKVLHTLGVRYDYIENSSVDDPVFRPALEQFIAAARVRKALSQTRIGQIGARIPFFWCTIHDEADLLHRFNVEILPFDMVEVMEGYQRRYRKNETAYKAELNTIIESWLNPGDLPREGMLKSLALRDELFDLAEKQHIDAFSLQNFDSLQLDLGPGSGLGIALAEEKLPIAAETDNLGALSSVLLEAASPDDAPSFFPEFTIRHPENDNAVLLWHASAAPSLRDTNKGKVEFLPPWILKSLPATSLQFPVKKGPVTTCRMDGRNGEYTLGVGEGRSIEGPYTREVYTWLEVDDWPRWERQLIEGPFIHHTSALFAQVGDILEKACTFIPDLTCQRFDRRSSSPLKWDNTSIKEK